jgi:hypothetical protein
VLRIRPAALRALRGFTRIQPQRSAMRALRVHTRVAKREAARPVHQGNSNPTSAEQAALIARRARSRQRLLLAARTVHLAHSKRALGRTCASNVPRDTLAPRRAFRSLQTLAWLACIQRRGRAHVRAALQARTPGALLLASARRAQLVPISPQMVHSAVQAARRECNSLPQAPCRRQTA